MFEPDVVRAPEKDGDDVETAIDAGGGPGGQIGLGDPADLPLLGRGHGFLGPAEGLVGPRLDLDEDERPAVAGDDIDLAPEQTDAPFDDLEAAVAEVAAGQFFAGPAQVLRRARERGNALSRTRVRPSESRRASSAADRP
jgi:hypothetical protein